MFIVPADNENMLIMRIVPMAVGKGVITTCNYKAREWGVRSGMAGHIAQSMGLSYWAGCEGKEALI